jgi:hypothetical protein
MATPADLVKQLESTNEWRDAARALFALGGDALPALADALVTGTEFAADRAAEVMEVIALQHSVLRIPLAVRKVDAAVGPLVARLAIQRYRPARQAARVLTLMAFSVELLSRAQEYQPQVQEQQQQQQQLEQQLQQRQSYDPARRLFDDLGGWMRFREPLETCAMICAEICAAYSASAHREWVARVLEGLVPPAPQPQQQQ